MSAIPVLGTLDALARILRTVVVNVVHLAISAACGESRWRVARTCVAAGVEFLNLPTGFDLNRRASMSLQLRTA